MSTNPFRDLLTATVERVGSRTAVVCGESLQTYGELFDRACRLANVLAALGAKPGDRIATLSGNRLESLEEMAALALGGFVRCPLYATDSPLRHAQVLSFLAPAVLIADDAYWQQLRPLLPQGVPFKVLVRGAQAAHDPGGVDYEREIAAASSAVPDAPAEPDSLHVIRFTAGTTGIPKPVAHSVRGYLEANIEVLAECPLTELDAYLAISPYSHGSGNLVWPALTAGAKHVVMQRFDPGEALRLIAAERCSILFLVPTMISALLRHPSAASTDFSSLRAIIYGAAPIPETLIDQAIAVFGNVLYQCYGQSEIVPVTMLLPADHEADAHGRRPRLASAGRPTRRSAVRIEGPDGKVLPPGEEGEIVARSPGQMMGIWNDEAATRARVTADGWIRTRDRGYIDEDGYLYVKDRIDDMIISGGFNIAPAEIEAALTEHPAVAQCVVFGVPHERWGSTPAAVVRLADPAVKIDPDDLIAWCRERVGPVKKPSYVIFTDEPLPMNAAGKLLRRAAREKYWPGVQLALAREA